MKMKMVVIYQSTNWVMILLNQLLIVESHGVVPDPGGRTKGNHPKVQVGLIHHDLAGRGLAHLAGKGVDPDLTPVI